MIPPPVIAVLEPLHNQKEDKKPASSMLTVKEITTTDNKMLLFLK